MEGLKQLSAAHTEQLRTLQQQLSVLQAALPKSTRKDELVAQRAPAGFSRLAAAGFLRFSCQQAREKGSQELDLRLD